jgi:glycosyltransferase involved in cell wall biosynthesis
MISFVIPAYNEEFELPETLKAIHAAAATAGVAYEIVLADDASTDATAAIARAAGAHVVPIQRRHIAAARNAGAGHARGDILFFVDADTRINSIHVREGIAALARGCSGGSSRIVAGGVIPWWGNAVLQFFCALYFANGLGAGAFIFTTRKNFEAVGGFNERYFAGEEVFLSMALKKIGPFEILREPMVTSGRKLRMHSGWHLWKQTTRILIGGLRSHRSREKLDLWYDGKRESGRMKLDGTAGAPVALTNPLNE